MAKVVVDPGGSDADGGARWKRQVEGDGRRKTEVRKSEWQVVVAG